MIELQKLEIDGMYDDDKYECKMIVMGSLQEIFELISRAIGKGYSAKDLKELPNKVNKRR